METGCQNIQLCVTILKVAFPPQVIGPMFLFPLLYYTFQCTEALLLTLGFRCYQAFKPPAEGKCHCVCVEWGWEEGWNGHTSTCTLSTHLQTLIFWIETKRKQKSNITLLLQTLTLNKWKWNSHVWVPDDNPVLKREMVEELNPTYWGCRVHSLSPYHLHILHPGLWYGQKDCWSMCHN